MKRLVQLTFLLLVSLAGTPDGNAQFFAGQQQALVNQWFDPADYGTPSLVIIPQQDPLFSAGNAASDVTDLSLNGYDFTQGTGANQPIWTAGATPSGLGALTFDGVNDFMSAGDVLDLGTSDRTVAIVSQRNAGTGTYLSKSRAAAGSGRWWIFSTTNSTEASYVTPPDNVRTASFSDGSTDWVLTVVEYDRSSGVYIYRNGSLEASTSISNSNDLQSTNLLLMGAYNDASGGASPAIAFFDGNIAAIVVWDEILADRAGMSSALMKYTGITP